MVRYVQDTKSALFASMVYDSVLFLRDVLILGRTITWTLFQRHWYTHREECIFFITSHTTINKDSSLPGVGSRLYVWIVHWQKQHANYVQKPCSRDKSVLTNNTSILQAQWLSANPSGSVGASKRYHFYWLLQIKCLTSSHYFSL